MISRSFSKYVIVLFTLTVLFISCGRKLRNKKETLKLHYISWGCDCANWVKEKDIRKYTDFPDSLANVCIFIEPGEISKALPDTIGYTGDIVEFTGKFYEDKGYPKDFNTVEEVKKAKIFQYESYKIVRSNKSQ